MKHILDDDAESLTLHKRDMAELYVLGMIFTTACLTYFHLSQYISIRIIHAAKNPVKCLPLSTHLPSS